MASYVNLSNLSIRKNNNDIYKIIFKILNKNILNKFQEVIVTLIPKPNKNTTNIKSAD